MSAPAQAASPKVPVDMPVRLIVEDVVMPPNMPLVRIPVREEVTRVIVSEKDETKPAASASYPYTRPLPATEGGQPMAGGHDAHGDKAHGTGHDDALTKVWKWGGTIILFGMLGLALLIGVERWLKGLPAFGSAGSPVVNGQSFGGLSGGNARTHVPTKACDDGYKWYPGSGKCRKLYDEPRFVERATCTPGDIIEVEVPPGSGRYKIRQCGLAP